MNIAALSVTSEAPPVLGDAPISSDVIRLAFAGHEVDFRANGWFNATVAAASFSKRLQDYLDNKETVAYMAALATALNHANERDLMKASRGRGGGTWFHPKLAIHFSRWLSLEFSVWCDQQIDKLLHGYEDWSRVRHQAAASYKVMQEVLRSGRELDGKTTVGYHYINEAKLVNWALTGDFSGLDRDKLTKEELDVLADLEIQNTLLMARSVAREDRKRALAARAQSAKQLGYVRRQKEAQALTVAA